MLLLSRVLSPVSKQESKPALKIVILIKFCHQSHHFATFHDSIVIFSFCSPCLVHQKLPLSLKLNIVSILNEAHVAHLIFHLSDSLLFVIDIADCLPVCENCKHVLSVLLQPMF